LKNLGLAVLNYHDTRKVFPTGGAKYVPATGWGLPQNLEGGRPLGPDRQGLSWSYQILPYIEETAAYSLTNAADLQKVVISLYVCPSRRLARTGWSEAFAGVIAFIDYAGAVPCTYTTPARTARYDPKIGVPLTQASIGTLATSFLGGTARNGAEPPDNALYDGVIVRCPWLWQRTDTASGKQIGMFRSRVTGLVKAADITDGTSKTFMIGEKYVRNDNYDGSFGGSNKNSDDRGWSDGYDADTMRSSCFTPIADSNPIGWDPVLGNMFRDTFSSAFAGVLWNVVHFGSAHPGGINAVYADGSVHSISFDVNVEVFNALGSRNGDETFTATDGVN
jgi:prepilin-type processing-associated H-X9-DG protein